MVLSLLRLFDVFDFDLIMAVCVCVCVIDRQSGIEMLHDPF